MVVSLTYRTALHLRAEDLTPTDRDAAQTTSNLQAILNLVKAFVPADGTVNERALHQAFASAKVEQHKTRVVLDAEIPVELLRANANSR